MSKFTDRRVAVRIQARLDQQIKDFEHLAKLAREALDSMWEAGDYDQLTSDMGELAVWLLMHTKETPDVVCYPDERPSFETVDGVVKRVR